MPLGTVGLLYGSGGVGKSLAALDLCLTVAARARAGTQAVDSCGPLGGLVAPEAVGASVFLTLEDDQAEVHRRTAALDPTGKRRDVPRFVIPAVDLPDFDPALVRAQGRAAELTTFAAEGLDTLLANVARAAGYPARLLVLDSAGDFLNADENDATFAKLLMRRLRAVAARHDCTIILLGHVAKTIDADGSSMRGSGAWVANSRFAYALWPPASE
jgi:RecA-family ATPase